MRSLLSTNTEKCLAIHVKTVPALKHIPIWVQITKYRQIFNIRRTLVGNKIVDHADVVGASPVGAAPNTSSFST